MEIKIMRIWLGKDYEYMLLNFLNLIPNPAMAVKVTFILSSFLNISQNPSL